MGKKEKKKCSRCGNEFEGTKKQAFCSKKCYMANYNEKIRPPRPQIRKSGNGGRQKAARAGIIDPWITARPPVSEAITLDAQLIRAIKKSAILDFVKNDLPRMIEEAFA